jgi:amino acid adenylation domain-containing protein
VSLLLHNLLERAADERPGHPAVVTDRRTVSYRELDAMAARVAAELGGAGVGAGDRVAVVAPKSVEAIAALYGVMKAGAAYVPIDPASPPPRAGFIARDCAVAAVVVDTQHRALLEPEVSGLGLRTVIDVEAVDALPPANGGGAQARDAIDRELAYVLYTSGSTGRPKGVMLSHRAAMSFVGWAATFLGLTGDDRFSGHAPLHFDLSVFDLYACAMVGGTLFPLAASDMALGARSAGFVERRRLTVWYSVPSALVAWVIQGGVEASMVGSLRHVVFAGEVFPAPYLRRLVRLVPGATLHNWYGPTETNVCTHHVVGPGDLVEGVDDPIPIGRATGNADCIAVRPDGEPAGAGEEGELFVRGSGVMTGYWGRPELTAEAMVPHPLDQGSPDRCYRTGDIVVPLGDGSFRFRGRRDHQVKTRGYRVELEEVEAAIHSHPSVGEACVVAVPDDRIGHALLAYVSAAKGASLEDVEVKRHVAGRLPRYMVPAEVRTVPSLPRTSTGKVDRQALATRALRAVLVPREGSA